MGVQAKERNLKLSEPVKFQTIVGKGVTAEVDGQSVIVGSTPLMDDNNVEWRHAKNNINSLRKDGKTAILVGINGELQAILGISDTIKENAREAVIDLMDLGLEVIMITG